MFNSTVMWKTSTILKLYCILFAKPTTSSGVVVPENFSFCLQPKPVCPIYVQYMSWLNLPPSFLSSLSASPNKCKDCVLFISLFDISSLISYYKPQQVTIWQSVSCLIIEALCCVLFESPLRLFQPNINIWWELSAEMSATSAVYQKPPTASQSFLLKYQTPHFIVCHCAKYVFLYIKQGFGCQGCVFIVEGPLQFAENLRWTALNIVIPIPMSNFVT